MIDFNEEIELHLDPQQIALIRHDNFASSKKALMSVSYGHIFMTSMQRET